MTATSPPDAGFRVSLQVDIPSDVAYIERVVELVRHPCAELSYNKHQLALNVPVALSEALSNAILRGNHEDPGKRVHVRADVDTNASSSRSPTRAFASISMPTRVTPPTPRTSSVKTDAGSSSCASSWTTSSASTRRPAATRATWCVSR